MAQGDHAICRSVNSRAAAWATLVLSAQRDQLVPPAETARMLALRPDCQHIALPGPHGLLQAQPVASALAIAGFLQQLC